MSEAHRSLAVLPKRDEFRADRTLDGLLKVWLKHIPKSEYDDLTDEDLDDDLSDTTNLGQRLQGGCLNFMVKYSLEGLLL